MSFAGIFFKIPFLFVRLPSFDALLRRFVMSFTSFSMFMTFLYFFIHLGPYNFMMSFLTLFVLRRRFFSVTAFFALFLSARFKFLANLARLAAFFFALFSESLSFSQRVFTVSESSTLTPLLSASAMSSSFL